MLYYSTLIFNTKVARHNYMNQCIDVKNSKKLLSNMAYAGEHVKKTKTSRNILFCFDVYWQWSISFRNL